MKKRIIAIVLLVATLLCLCSCSNSSKESTFSIRFIDVGQGDAALVECDDHYMLIDSGPKSAGDTIYEILNEKHIKKLDILAISHLHEDHIGGLAKALPALQGRKPITLTISNTDGSNTEIKEVLSKYHSKIEVPKVGKKYKLGSATVEVIDVSAERNNDSLVLMITYEDTRFLFTGDIEEAAQTRISDKYQNESDDPFKIDLIKMPHHGSYTKTLYRFVRTFKPDYFIISVGENNEYRHPHWRTIELIENFVVDVMNLEWNDHVYRTDKGGDIVVVVKDGKVYIKHQDNIFQ